VSELAFTTIQGVTLHYTLDGVSTGLPLVFLNSLGTDLRIWDKVIPALANRYRLIRYDQRGHGLSDCPPGPYTLRDHTHDLAGLLAQLQVNQAVLIGNSVGGMIALDFAASRPQQVKALVLCDTAAKIGTTEYWNERIATLRQHGLSYLAPTILERWFSPAFIAQYPADYRGYSHMLTRTPLEGYIATCETIKNSDLREIVPTLEVNALVLGGAEDGATPPELVRGLAEALPNAYFEMIERAGHIPGIEQPAVLAAKINRFLSENGYV
jgi:3-oxoadipate enol-lactonase